MTRINVVPVTELSKEHLIAEYRELPRIFRASMKAIARNELPTDKRNPLTYKLGTGHMRFFYTRLQFCVIRQQLLVNEMVRRGYRPTFDPAHFIAMIAPLPECWKQDYTPTPEALALNRARIKERS